MTLVFTLCRHVLQLEVRRVRLRRNWVIFLVGSSSLGRERDSERQFQAQPNVIQRQDGIPCL